MSGRETMAPHKGTRLNTLSRLAEAMSFALSRRRGTWIQCARFEHPQLSPKSTRIVLERSVVAKRAVLILLGRGHYTVLRGYTSGSWLLFDAMGRLWMQRSRLKHEGLVLPIVSLSRSS